MTEPVFGIVIEASTELQREQVQAAVKQHADRWWHGMADLWLVVGRSAPEWRDLIKPIFPTLESGKLIVFKLSNSWAARGRFSETETEWLHKNLGTVDRSKADD